ncbi:MAG: hypothetical protein P1V51_22020 [Deltaproteobacteria bacterium]|nr:hypothetical protein [Deltaproteobacteria bacterium]
MTHRRLLAALSLLLLTACSTVQGASVLSRSRGKVQPYDGELEAASRSAMLYSGFDRVMTVSITLMTPAYQGALDAELERLARAEVRESLGLEAPPAEGLDLVLFLDGRDPAWEDLEDRSSTFRVELLEGERATPATLVRRLDEEDPTLRHLFPQVGDFGRLYRLRAAGVSSSAGELSVRIAGAPGDLVVGF